MVWACPDGESYGGSSFAVSRRRALPPVISNSGGPSGYRTYSDPPNASGGPWVQNSMHLVSAASPASSLATQRPSLPGNHDAIEAAVARFPSISLADVGHSALMDRLDSKFLVPASLIPTVLDQCVGHYRVLEVGGRRICRYATTYFDTTDLAFYRAHQTGRLPRRKVRLRNYLDTGARFLEVKIKTNKGRTIKTRVPVDGDASTKGLLDARQDAQSPCDRLSASLHVEYQRVTLVNSSQDERVTFDLALTMSFEHEALACPGVTIIEVKRATRGRSWFLNAMRRHKVRAESFSKYCLGVSALRAEATRHRDPSILRKLQHASDRFTHVR